MATSSETTASSKPVELDPKKFSFGPTPIQTAEDATMAYLREEISEDEYRTALGKFGVVPGQVLKVTGERPDTAFKNTIPDDIYTPQPNPEDTLDARVKAVSDAEKEREAAAKEAEKAQTTEKVSS